MAEDEAQEDGSKEDQNQEDGDGTEEEEEGAGGFDVKKIVLFVVLPLLLLVGIGGGLYFSGMLDGLLGKSAAVALLDEHGEPVLDEHGEPVMIDPEGEGGEHAEVELDEHGNPIEGGYGTEAAAFLAIPTMIVNLATASGTPRYLRLSVQLELENEADLAAVEAVIPRVIDQFQTYLRELRIKDLRGSAGIYRLQMELLWRVNQAAAPIEVKDVLFQEILIQ